MKQKLTLLFLCLAMVLSLCSVFTLGASAANLDAGEPTALGDISKWDGVYAKIPPESMFDGSDGCDGQTPETAWRIETAAQLGYLNTKIVYDKNNDFSDDYFVLVNDVDMAGINFNSLGSQVKIKVNGTNVNFAGKSFKGTFDGGGHTIYNLAGVFCSSFDGKICNLNVVNATGSFISKISGGTRTISNCSFNINSKSATYLFNCVLPNSTTTNIEDVVITGKLTSTATDQYCSAFVKETKASGVVTIKNSANYADITASNSVGAFIGGVLKSATLINCYNFGTITCVNENKNCSVGGFIGMAINGNHDYTFYNCANYGKVISMSKVLTNSADASISGGNFGGTGGFVGYAPNGAYSNLYFYNCASYGAVSAESGPVGGFVGAMGYTSKTTVDLQIKNSIALAEVSSKGEDCVGEIFGCGNTQSGFTNKYVYTATGLAENFAAHVGNSVFSDCGKFVPGTDENSTIAKLNQNVQDHNGAENVSVKYQAWTEGAFPIAAGAKVSLGNSIKLDIYAKCGAVLESQTVDTLFVNGSSVSGVSTKIGNDPYMVFSVDTFKVEDVAQPLVLQFKVNITDNASFTVEKNYSVVDYICNVYEANDEETKAMLEALLYYIDAAQKKANIEETLFAAVTDKIGLTYSESYVEDAYKKAGLKVHPGLNGNAIALDLYGTIAARLLYAEGATKVVVTCGNQSAVYEDLGAGFVWFQGINATSLNNLITVKSYVGDEVVEYDTSVAMYVTTALEAGNLAENEAYLAKALVAYMKAARTYHEYLYPIYNQDN